MKRDRTICRAAACLPALLALVLCACSEKRAAVMPPAGTAAAVTAPSFSGPGAECLRAGGKTRTIKECDGSDSLWCDISPREACYADQVAGGRCTAGQYSEELKGITGITPRVLCDQGQ